MTNFTKILVLPLVTLTMNCNNCYSSELLEQNFDSSIDNSTTDDSNKKLNINDKQKNIYKKPRVKNSISINKKSIVNPNIKRINALREKFDKKINKVIVLQEKILENFPQCEETKCILEIIKEFKQLCYFTPMDYKDEEYIIYTYTKIIVELEQFLHEDSEYKQVMKKLNKHYYNKKNNKY